MTLPASKSSALPNNGASAPDVSVIIVSWNVRDDLLRCISALLSRQVSGDLAIEIIVVDNASHDGTSQALSNLPVILITSPENLGYGRANNTGLRAARGRHLLILNPDTIPLPGMLEPLVSIRRAQSSCRHRGTPIAQS